MPLFQRSVVTDALINALRGVNDEVSYGFLATQCNTSVQHVKQALQYARTHLYKRERVLFHTIKGVGLKRLDDPGVLSDSYDGNKRVNRESRRRIQKLNCIHDFGKLSKNEQQSATTQRLLFNMVAGTTSPARRSPPAITPTPLPNFAPTGDGA